MDLNINCKPNRGKLNEVFDLCTDTLVDLNVMGKGRVQLINFLPLKPCDIYMISSCLRQGWCKTLEVLMSLEQCIGLFVRVQEEVNSFLIFSKGLRLLDLATSPSVTRYGRATKLVPHHLLHHSMLDLFINEFAILVFVVTRFL